MKKFKDAFRGLKTALAHKAVRIQLLLGVFAFCGGALISLDCHEWLAFIICIAMVISAEIMNTAVERIGDYLNEKEDERVRQIKDLASASVLVSAMGALAICLFCVIRRILG